MASPGCWRRGCGERTHVRAQAAKRRRRSTPQVVIPPRREVVSVHEISPGYPIRASMTPVAPSENRVRDKKGSWPP